MWKKSQKKEKRRQTNRQRTHTRATVSTRLKSWVTHTPSTKIYGPNSILWTRESWLNSILWSCAFNACSNHLNWCTSTNDRCYCLRTSYQIICLCHQLCKMSHHRPLWRWLCSQHKLNHACHWLCSQAGLATTCKLFSLWWATEQHCLISTMLPSPCHRYRTICSLQGLPNYQFLTRLTDYMSSFPGSLNTYKQSKTGDINTIVSVTWQETPGFLLSLPTANN